MTGVRTFQTFSPFTAPLASPLADTPGPTDMGSLMPFDDTIADGALFVETRGLGGDGVSASFNFFDSIAARLTLPKKIEIDPELAGLIAMASSVATRPEMSAALVAAGIEYFASDAAGASPDPKIARPAAGGTDPFTKHGPVLIPLQRGHENVETTTIDVQYRLQVDVSYPQHHDFLVRKGLSEAQYVLDVGTGNGYFVGLLARDHPSTKFTGIDKNASMIKIARGINKGFSNVSWIVDDVLKPTFFQANEGKFDGILMRLAAFHNPNIEEILRSLNRLLRPGGHIWIIDVEMDYMKCSPKHLAFTRFKTLVGKLYEKFGFDGHMGSKLSGLLMNAGFNMVNSEVAPMSNHVVGPGRFKKLMLHEAEILSSVMPDVVSKQDMLDIEAFVNTHLKDPAYTVSYGVVMISAQK